MIYFYFLNSRTTPNKYFGIFILHLQGYQNNIVRDHRSTATFHARVHSSFLRFYVCRDFHLIIESFDFRQGKNMYVIIMSAHAFLDSDKK